MKFIEYALNSDSLSTYDSDNGPNISVKQKPIFFCIYYYFFTATDLSLILNLSAGSGKNKNILDPDHYQHDRVPQLCPQYLHLPAWG